MPRQSICRPRTQSPAWLEERCRRNPQAWIATGALFADWTRWATAAGEYVGSQRRFSQNLETRGFMPRRDRTEGRGFVGLELMRAEPETAWRSGP